MAQSCTNLHQGVKHISHRKDRSLQKKGPDDTKPATFTTFKSELPKHKTRFTKTSQIKVVI